MHTPFRQVLAMAALIAVDASFAARAFAAEPLPATRMIAAGPIAPTWESLVASYRCPEWFRDAKLGIWAHWGPQCEPGEGDWYARNIYMQGHKQYEAHLEEYGHPSEVGFMEIDNQWKAERWEPETLMDCFVAAGARYFVAMATHGDNFDAYDSRCHGWNSVRVGPRRDIIGDWAKAARARGLRFGVSNHSSHAWHWFQTAYGYDAEGPRAGVRYDAYRLTKADGVGKWKEGLDLQDLYCRPRSDMVIPDGITTIAAARQWHDKHNLPWTEEPPSGDPESTGKWFFRVQDLVDRYEPDFLYLDNTELPLGQAGLDIAAHFYNASLARHGGSLEAVLTARGLRPERRPAVVQDFERSAPDGNQPQPFETGTCIGQRHYKKDIEYKTVAQVVPLLVDVVSKNGTLLLSIPQRGDGSIDEHEVAFLEGLGAWMRVNGEAIYGSRPWTTFGEGPTKIPRGRAGDALIPFTAEDFRFTTKDGTLHVFAMTEPAGPSTIKALGLDAPTGRRVAQVELVGSDETLRWRQDGAALHVAAPARLLTEWARTLGPDADCRMSLYSYDKLVCGLLDQHLYVDNPDAVPLLRRTLAWAMRTFPPERSAATRDRNNGEPSEWYTFSENLHRAFEVIGDASVKAFADTYLHPGYWDQFATTAAPTAAHHVRAYSHVNSFSSVAIAYSVSGDTRYLDILRHACDFMRDTPCYATGGFGPMERWLIPDQRPGVFRIAPLPGRSLEARFRPFYMIGEVTPYRMYHDLDTAPIPVW